MHTLGRALLFERVKMLLIEPVMRFLGCRIPNFYLEMGSFLLCFQFAVTFLTLIDVFVVLSALLFPVADVRKECRLQVIISHHLGFIRCEQFRSVLVWGGLWGGAINGSLGHT